MLQKLEALFKLVSSRYLLLYRTAGKGPDICHTLEARLGVANLDLQTLRFGHLSSKSLAFHFVHFACSSFFRTKSLPVREGSEVSCPKSL